LQFAELSGFVKDILHRLPTLEKVKETWKQQRHAIKPSIILPYSATLVSLVPDQTTTDSLVQVYFEILETTYRVLHVPSFFRAYKEFWVSPHDAPQAFVVQLLLVCACANNAVERGLEGYFGPCSLTREAALKWIDVCEVWLELQSQKHMTLEVFQVQVLIPIAKRLNCVKVKREWTVTGHLLRLAMSAGLHREPTYLTQKISTFDREMRRRLWFTILELDVQASLDRGMCASLGPYDWDCLAPSNLHDEDFDQNTGTLPGSLPITEATRTSFLHLAQRHLPLRLEILSRLNSLHPWLEYDTAIEIHGRVSTYLDDLPRWTDEAAKVSQDLSELLLHEFLLLIHQPFAADAKPQARHFFSRVARRNAALSTAKIYAELPPATQLLFTNLRGDLPRALLSLCHDVMVSLDTKEALLQDRAAVVGLIERGVETMERRIRRLGQGFHSFWLTCSALGLMRSKLLPDKAPDVHARETADRVAQLHRHMMEKQVTPPGDQAADGIEDAAMSTANTLVGMSGQALPNPGLVEMDPFGPDGEQYNVFSDTLFNFDMPEFWAPTSDAHPGPLTDDLRRTEAPPDPE
jgi:hypothetical protein